MRLIIDPSQIDSSPEQFLLRSGYGHIFDRRRGVDSFVQRLGGGFYPRLHMYVNLLPDGRIAFDLHLDQKEASYAGSHMHNADYDGPVVAEEIERLRGLIRPATANTAPGAPALGAGPDRTNAQRQTGGGQQAVSQASTLTGEADILNKIRPADYDEEELESLPARRSFWQRLFG